MVVFMVQETLEKNRDHCAMTVVGENAANSIKRQCVLDILYATFLELSGTCTFFGNLVSGPHPRLELSGYHTVGIILSAEGIQQGMS